MKSLVPAALYLYIIFVSLPCFVLVPLVLAGGNHLFALILLIIVLFPFWIFPVVNYFKGKRTKALLQRHRDQFNEMQAELRRKEALKADESRRVPGYRPIEEFDDFDEV